MTKPEYISVVAQATCPAPPPLVLMTLTLRTIHNPRTHHNEVVAAACLLQHHFHADKPAPKPHFQQHFCGTWPVWACSLRCNASVSLFCDLFHIFWIENIAYFKSCQWTISFWKTCTKTPLQAALLCYVACAKARGALRCIECVKVKEGKGCV